MGTRRSWAALAAAAESKRPEKRRPGMHLRTTAGRLAVGDEREGGSLFVKAGSKLFFFSSFFFLSLSLSFFSSG